MSQVTNTQKGKEAELALLWGHWVSVFTAAQGRGLENKADNTLLMGDTEKETLFMNLWPQRAVLWVKEYLSQNLVLGKEVKYSLRIRYARRMS